MATKKTTATKAAAKAASAKKTAPAWLVPYISRA